MQCPFVNICSLDIEGRSKGGNLGVTRRRRPFIYTRTVQERRVC